MLKLKVTQCTGHTSPNTRPHQLHQDDVRNSKLELTYLVSVVQLSELLHLLLLESGGDLSYAMGENVDDLMQDLEHGLGNDLQHLRNGMETRQLDAQMVKRIWIDINWYILYPCLRKNPCTCIHTCTLYIYMCTLHTCTYNYTYVHVHMYMYIHVHTCM